MTQSTPTARLSSANGESGLRFYSEDLSPALELGVNPSQQFRFVRFLGADGKVLAALLSTGKNSEATLYLGDSQGGSRMIVGAIPTDSIGDAAEEWGLELLKPNSHQPILSMSARPGNRSASWTAGIRLLLPDGTFWSRP